MGCLPEGAAMIETKCGKTMSGRGNPFTPESLAQHESDCYKCNGGHRVSYRAQIKELGLNMTDMIAGDESDGVFWAMAWELGEWF